MTREEMEQIKIVRAIGEDDKIVIITDEGERIELIVLPNGTIERR